MILGLDVGNITTRLTSQLAGTVHVGTADDVDFKSKFKEAGEQVWVLGQRVRPLDRGLGFTGPYRQKATVEVALTIVAPRFVQGVANNAAVISALRDATATALLGWKADDALDPFVLGSSTSGPVGESIALFYLTVQSSIMLSQ